MDFSNRRWGTAAVLALLAGVLLALAAFLPLFHSESVAAPVEEGIGERFTADGWGHVLGMIGSPGRRDPTALATGYQQLFGAALALAAGLLAMTAARKSARGRKGTLVLLVAAGAFNTGVVSIIAALLKIYFDHYPATNGAAGRITSNLGLGAWCLLVGVLLSIAATVAVLRRERERVVALP